MRKRLLLLSFIEGAAVMVAELCGAKLLAPVFGSSLYVWASVMGFTLAALAAGYFFGGRLSASSPQPGKQLFRMLSASALFLLLMPVISYYVVPRISYLPFLPGVVVSTLLLLFPAVFFLGTTSPLFILLQTRESQEAGKVSGTVYAVSTAGGIIATFLCGFWFIPAFGLNACLLLAGGLLFVANSVVMKFFKSTHLLLLFGFAYLNTQVYSATGPSLQHSDGMLGRLEVKDIADAGKTYRILTINDIVQTEMDLQTGRSVSKYMQLIDTLTPGGRGANALVLGLGGGLMANLLIEKEYRTDGVELDKRIVDAAKDHFHLDKRAAAFHEDARCFLNRTTKTYKLVVVDVFKGEEQPSHILTLESLERLKENLADSALLVVNWHGYVKGKKGLGTAILYNTLSKAGFDLKLCSYSSDESYRNILLVASLQALPALPYELNEAVEPTELVNTDDRPLLEKFNAEANKAWRLSYLRYYQNKK